MAETLTDKEQRFVHEVSLDVGTRKDAAIRAGYSPEGAAQQASALMKKPKIKQAIQETREELGARMGITPERILQELMLIGFANPQEYMTEDEDGNQELDLSKVKGHAGRAFTVEVETSKSGTARVQRTKFKMLDKADALLKMGKQIGMFTEKVEHQVSMSLEDLVANSYKKPDEIKQPEVIEVEFQEVDNSGS